MAEDGENDPWLLIDRSPLEEKAPEAVGDESDTRRLRVGSNGGALLDSVDEPTELVERDSEDEVECDEKMVLVECDNVGVAGVNPEDPEGGIDEDEGNSPEG